jgi:hypothetical protein
MKFQDLLLDRVEQEKRIRGSKVAKILDASKAGKFEKIVLGYLNENKELLGIKAVYALKNILLDGAVRLNDERLILIECKCILDWKNECNARVEIEEFMAKKMYTKLPNPSIPERALIVFKEFCGDWDRKPNAHNFKNGWNFFYEEENAFRKERKLLPIDIAQLTEEDLFTPFKSNKE